MLVPDGSAGSAETTLQHTVKILDVGLGRALFDEGTPGVVDAVTRPADQIGTGAYRAPEQTRNAHAADIRADLYSLGCVLYHCLVGDPPFHEPNPVQMAMRHASEKPLALRDHGLVVPEGLQGLLDALLAKDPALRPATPEKAARELRRFLTG
jgi:serine/threonine protein kinase